MKNKNSLIIVLVVIILGLGGYITYDKFFTNKENNENKEFVQVNENTNQLNTQTQSSNSQKQSTNNIEQSNNSENKTSNTSDYDLKISYKTEKYEIKDSKSNEIVVGNERNLPVIESTKYKQSASKIVNYLTKVSNKDWDDLKEQSDELKENEPDIRNVGVSYLFDTIRKTDNYVTFAYNMEGSLGGVSWVGIWGYNFDVKTGDILEFDDVINSNNSKDDFYNYAIKELKSLDEDGFEDWKDTVKKDLFKTGNWYFTDDEIVFTFDKYSLGPGALGVVVVKVPYQDANQYLKSEYRK